MARMLTAVCVFASLTLLVGCQNNKPKDGLGSADATPVKVAPAPAPEVSRFAGPAVVEPLPTTLTLDAPPAPAPRAAAARVAPAPAAKSAPKAALAKASTKATSTKTAKATAAHGKYIIKPGDSLWKIAAAKYGSGSKWKQIAAANPGLDPNKVRAGQTIILP